MKLSAAAISVRGNVRQVNQDNLYIGTIVRPLDEQDFSHECMSAKENQVFSVCDGMGGEQAGEEASYRAVKVLADLIANQKSGNDWDDYIIRANEKVCELCRERDIHAGTTFAGVFFAGKACKAVNVGDSRIYLISHNRIRQISIDHTQFQTMVDAGLIDKNDKTHKRARSELTQHLGIERELLELEPHAEELNNLKQGDMFLLCSDGLYGDVEDSDLLAMAQAEGNLLKCCSAMVERAEENGSRDNITAMLIRIEEGQEVIQKEKSTRKDAKARSKGEPILKIITAILGIICIALVVMHMKFVNSWPMVPDVTGQLVTVAKEELESSGFQVKIEESSMANTDDLIVGNQSIPGNVRVKRGSEIILIPLIDSNEEEEVSKEVDEESEENNKTESIEFIIQESSTSLSNAADSLAEIIEENSNSSNSDNPGEVS